MAKSKVFMLLGATLAMTGCSPYKTDFQCPMGKGYACKSMSYVHEQVKQGKVDDNPEEDRPKIYFPPQPDISAAAVIPPSTPRKK